MRTKPAFLMERSADAPASPAEPSSPSPTSTEAVGSVFTRTAHARERALGQATGLERITD